MNQELIDRIQRDAVTIQRLTGEVETIKREQEQSARNYKEKLQTEETRYARLLSETTDKLYVSQRFAELQKQRLQEAQQRIEEKDSEIGKLITLSNDRAREIGRLKETHAQDLARIEKLSALKGLIEGAAKDHGINESDALKWLVNDICGDNKRQRATVTRLQNVLTKIHAAAKAGGLKQGEPIDAFIQRINEDLYKVRCDAASESMKMGNANKQLQRSYDEANRKYEGENKLHRWAKDELNTARAESLRARTELSEIAKIVNPEGENGPVIDFVRATSNQLTVSHKLHSAAVEERNNAQEEVRKLSAELAKETRRLREYEDDYAQIYSLAASAGMHGNESVKQCLERKLAELSTVTADRDRIRTELAAIIAEANKSGRCNGDPVQLLKQGQADLDALIHFENASAELNALVSQLQGELAEARAGQQMAEPTDMKAQIREETQDYEIVRAQLDRIAKTAKRCGRTDKESVIDFMNRQQRERGAERAASTAACSRSVGQLERRLAEIQAVANRSNRLACDPIALIIQGQRDHMTLTELLKERPRIDANSNGHPVSGDSKEVVRLSEGIAELQVELDEARGKYSDIVAALENETLQQLIKRTDRSAKEQNASLKAQLEKVQTILRQEMKDHQAAREAMTAAYKAAGVSGMRNDEELPAFINRLFAQMSELRTAAHECGMLPDGNLRSFIYRSRRQLIDATEAGDRLQKLATETSAKLNAALATVANQSAAIAEAQRVTEKYTAACKAATKLKDWASLVRHKVLVKIVHDRAMQEYDNIIKELDGEAVANGS